MGRIIVMLIMLVASWYFYSGKDTPVITDIAYNEGRLNFSYSEREIEMVVISERPASEDCSSGDLYKAVEDVCVEDEACSESDFSCLDDIADRYKNMLDENGSHIRYVHITDSVSKLRAIIAVWGVTAEESDKVCKSILKSFKSHSGREMEVQCI